MKKRLISIFLQFTLSLLFINSLFAQELLSPGVYDQADILSTTEEQVLTSKLQQISHKYGCGAYIFTVQTLSDYDCGNNIEYLSEMLYLNCSRENVLFLLLSMNEREFDICAHGKFGNYSFTDYGKTRLEAAFINQFKNDRWYDGFNSYVSKVDSFLEKANEGNPVDVGQRDYDEDHPLIALGGGLLIGLLVALITCLVLKRGMKTVKPAKDAGRYIDEREVKLSHSSDRYSHSTHVKIDMGDKNNNGGGHGGTTVNSGGFSHHSGKF